MPDYFLWAILLRTECIAENLGITPNWNTTSELRKIPKYTCKNVFWNLTLKEYASLEIIIEDVSNMF